MAKGGFPGMMGGGNMQQLARQAAKLQQQLQDAQEQLAARALLGEDELCGEYLRAYRSGRFF